MCLTRLWCRCLADVAGRVQHGHHDRPLRLARFAVQDTSTPFSVFVIISLLCGFAGANFASSMANISFFFPKAKQGGALGINGGLGNMGVSVMQLIAPLAISVSIFAAFGGGGVEQADGSSLYLQNAAGSGYLSWWSSLWQPGSL